jgi:squalene-hopene/tetraprenyl-beta-curcumene cyclase
MKEKVLGHHDAQLQWRADETRLDRIDGSITSATRRLLSERREDGHFCFELEADATIPAEYVLFRHFPRRACRRGAGSQDRRLPAPHPGEHGGWPLFHEGAFDMSASVKAYFALKMIGDDIDEPHMRTAREAIRTRGGAAKSNVFTRFLLALYGQVPWRAVPTMPVEIMLLPEWFPFHLSKISYWARTVIVPLLVLQALKPLARNELGIGVAELFLTPPEEVREWPKGAHQTRPWAGIFGGIDGILKRVESMFPQNTRQRALDAAVAFVDERLNGWDGLGAIFPAMANSVLMYDALGVPADDPRVVMARESIEGLLVVRDHEAYCQPCLSPIWDTALACHALLEAGSEDAEIQAQDGLTWLKPKQVLDVRATGR